MHGTEPATILPRPARNISEYFWLQLKQKMWRGMRTHAAVSDGDPVSPAALPIPSHSATTECSRNDGTDARAGVLYLSP